MPIYEFRCQNCQKRMSIFVKSVSSPITASCPSCGSKELVRLISSFGIKKSLKSVHEESGDPNGEDYYKDPRNIGREVERKFSQMGEEVPSGIRDMIDAARDGEMPGMVKDLQPNIREL